MALKKQTLSLSFEKGLNTKASDRVLNIPHMADIKNGRMEKSGEIRRRNGLDPLQNTNLPDWVRYDYDLGSVATKDKFTKVVNVGSRKDELVLLDGKDAYGKQGDHEYVRKGICDSVTMRNDVIRDDRNFIQSRAELGRIDSESYGNWILAVWFQVDPSWQGFTAGATSATVTYDIYAQLWDADTGAEFGQRQLVQSFSVITTHADISPERAYFSPKPRIVVSGNNFVILWNQMVIVSGPVTENHLRYRIINMASTPLLGPVLPNTSTSLLTVSDSTVGMHAAWDACEFRYDETDGVAVFVRLGTGSTSYQLQEYVIDSGQLSTTDQRVYSVTQTATPRTSIDWNKEKPNAYGVFVRHHQPNGSDSDVAACYTLGMNELVSTLAEGRFQLIDAQTSILELEGSEISDADCEGMLNGSAVLDPSASPSADVRVYYVAETLNANAKPNDTTLKSIKFRISDGNAVHTKIAMNTGLLSDPWVEDGRIYFMGSEACAPKGDQDVGATIQQFIAGATYIFRDMLKDGPVGSTILRDRCVPVARTNGEGEVAVNPYINHYLLNSNFPGLNTAEFAVSMYWGACRVIAGSNPDQKMIGNNRWAEFLLSDQAVFSSSIVTVSHQPRRTLPMVEHNENLLIGGGFMMSYDGYSVNENGFLRQPEFSKTFVTADGATSGVTGRIETGTYNYVAIYEYIDAAGNIHRSAPSLPQEVVIDSAGSNAYVTLQIYTLNHSLRYRDTVRVVLYRTTKDQTNFYRVDHIDNDWDSKSVTITDVHRDTDIFPEDNPDAAHEILYSSASGKKVGIPGSISDIVIHKNRVMFSTVDNRVFAAKPPVRTVAMEAFSEADVQFGEVEGGTEPVHGIETAGDHLLVLTKNNVYVISGEGPDASGGTSAFTPPRLLVAGQGAVEGTFHINTPRGVLYQSERGVYSINRELQLQYIGAPVEDFGVYRALAAIADDSRHEVYIALGSRLDGTVVATGYSTVLVYNYFFDAWSQYTYDKDFVGYNSPGLHFHNGTVYFGRMRYASYSGRTSTYELDSTVCSGIWQENQKNYWDKKYGSSPTYSKYETVIETPFIYTNLLQGAQRIYDVQFLGDYLGDHDIAVEMTVDYDATSAHSQTKTASTLTNKDVYRLPVKRQKCRALKVKHTITPNGSSSLTNEMFRMDGLALEVGFRPTTFKLPAGDTI